MPFHLCYIKSDCYIYEVMPELTNEHRYDNVDLNNVAPIQQKRILAFVNHFLTTMAQFLNNFAVRCEEKMQNFEEKIQKVEASLLILEAKLSSIPELDSKPDASKSKEENCKESPSNTNISNNDLVIDSNNDSNTSVDAGVPLQKEDVSNREDSEKKSKADPNYERFFKMLQVGVPLEAVKLKMQIEGLDASVLST